MLNAVAAFALDGVIRRCAPHVGALTMRAIVARESGGRPFAIGDNTARRAYFPPTAASASRLAERLRSERHDLDLGLAQINVANFAAGGLTVTSAFDACANLRAAAAILRADYGRAVRRYGMGQAALAHALAAYNSGSELRGIGYARAVYRAASSIRRAGLP